jgi:uncharacterized delta-60 repeat protein
VFFTEYNGVVIEGIIRLNSDGSYDNTYQTGPGATGEVVAMHFQSDGKLIIAGGFASYNGTTVNNMARLNTDGTVDTSFSVGSGNNFSIFDIDIQADGKIFVAGSFTLFDGTSVNRLVRLNTDGSVDNSFATGTGFAQTVQALLVYSSGSLIAGGEAVSSYNGTTIGRIVAIESDLVATNPSTCGTTNTAQTATSADTSVCLEITAGVAALYAGDDTDHDDICTPGDDATTIESVACDETERSSTLEAKTVLNVRQETNSVVHDVVIEDLRGLQAAQYDVDVAMCDLVGDQATPETYPLGYTGDGGSALYARVDSDTNGIIEALKPATTVTAYTGGENANWTKGADTQVTDTATQIAVYNTTADVTPGRYDIDALDFGFELPAFIVVGNYTCDVTFTLTV